MIDDYEWKNVMNKNNSYYFPIPWKEEMQLPNPQNVIPDVCIALLPFIMDLVHYFHQLGFGGHVYYMYQLQL